MNQKNVEALAQALYLEDTAGIFGSEPPLWLARNLAARGVLVPASLTDEEAANLTIGWDSGYWFGDDGNGPATMRADLERAAGKPPEGERPR